jgi:hypothetical protein
MKPRIKQRNLQFPPSLAGACSVLLVLCALCAGQVGFAQQSEPGKPSAAPTVYAALSLAAPAEVKEADEASTPRKGGLKIHGHWVVEVRRGDGTLGDRREFENSYIGGGYMGYLLGGAAVDIDTAILFGSATNGAGSFCSGANSNQCAIVTSLTSGHGAVDSQVFSKCPAVPGGASCYPGLTSTFTSTSWVLAGNIMAQGSGTFDTVATSVGNCFPVANQAPVTSLTSTQCNTNAVAYATANNNNAPSGPYYNNSSFTSSAVPGGAVSVTAGETLAFTVTITFQ